MDIYWLFTCIQWWQRVPLRCQLLSGNSINLPTCIQKLNQRVVRDWPLYHLIHGCPRWIITCKIFQSKLAELSFFILCLRHTDVFELQHKFTIWNIWRHRANSNSGLEWSIWSTWLDVGLKRKETLQILMVQGNKVMEYCSERWLKCLKLLQWNGSFWQLEEKASSHRVKLRMKLSHRWANETHQ